ncbi:probable carboxylesterase 4, mitochondrial [Mangifera indica]|uniref:probable carboxylesterase 4, mitochondrial n=1 Tax=Mangifera indica TaxID=29780 RepID=UPI001CFA7BF1|nr:probable carboxylesterase 4, mitochondrial [Mangifera indica]
MISSSKEIIHDFPPFFKVYKDGTIERYIIADYVPTGLDPTTGIQTKDVVISPETGVKVRLFITKLDGPNKKLPVVVHFHGGGFSIGSAFDTPANNFLKFLVSQVEIIAISIDYRLGPENLLPIAYNDSWEGLQWVASHSLGLGPEPWLNEYADLGQVFLAGESAGANIAHHVAIRAGTTGLVGSKVIGALIVHPFFVGKEVDEMYKYICPTSSGCDDDPKLNPSVDPNLKSMGCDKVLVFVAEKDRLRNLGVGYYESLVNSEWPGKVELYETLGEDHCFHLFNLNSEKARALMKKMVDFITQY